MTREQSTEARTVLHAERNQREATRKAGTQSRRPVTAPRDGVAGRGGVQDGGDTCACRVCSAAQLCRLFATLWTVAHQAPLSMGISQARILQWAAMPSSRGSSQPRDQIQLSHTAGRFFTI